VEELVFAVSVAILTLAAGLVGFRLRTWLPEPHAPDRARKMIGSMTGLLGLCQASVKTGGKVSVSEEGEVDRPGSVATLSQQNG
jgi:hypothetical protein